MSNCSNPVWGVGLERNCFGGGVLENREERFRKLVTDIGHRAREIRKDLGHTQASLAEELGMSITYYRRIEGGRINLSVKSIERLAYVLRVEPKMLLDDPCVREYPKRGRPRNAELN